MTRFARTRWMVVYLAAAVVVFAIASAVYLFALPPQIEPAAWGPPRKPDTACLFAPNDRLRGLSRLAGGIAFGPEDVAFDADGRIYTGFRNGQIIRVMPDDPGYEVVVNTGGRPLGLAFDSEGNLIVADKHKGLLKRNPGGQIATLAREAGGVAFGFTNDVDVGPDGTIYFTDSTSAGDPSIATWEHTANGRLLAYDPQSSTTRVLLEGLVFPNGVAVGPGQTFVLVAESLAYRIVRYWLKGPKAGQTDLFVDGLPGFPDNISWNGRDRFWVALYAARNAILDRLASRPFLRRLAFRIPNVFLRKVPWAVSHIISISPSGVVLDSLQDPANAFAPTTSAEEYGGRLYLGSSGQSSLAYVNLIDRPQQPTPQSSTNPGLPKRVTFDWSSHRCRSPGSDNWPVTWAADGHQYTAWGDGGGFGGTNTDGRVFLGVARIVGEAPGSAFVNLNGGITPQSIQSQWGLDKAPANPGPATPFKSYGILALDGRLYMWVNDPQFVKSTLWVSTSHGPHGLGEMWLPLDPPVAFNEVDHAFSVPIFLNMGQENSAARDDYIYVYAPAGGAEPFQSHDAIDLARVKVTEIENRSSYEFFAGLNGAKEPKWTPAISARQPIMEAPGKVHWTIGASYNPGLDTYLLFNNAGPKFDEKNAVLEIYGAKEPWGPFVRISSLQGFGGGYTFYYNLPPKWIDPDGRHFTLVYAGTGQLDAWHSVEGTFLMSGP